MSTEPMVNYAHASDLNIRFVQFKKDPLPAWAVDVRDHHEVPERVRITYPGTEPTIIDTPAHLKEHYATKGWDLPFVEKT